MAVLLFVLDLLCSFKQHGFGIAKGKCFISSCQARCHATEVQHRLQNRHGLGYNREGVHHATNRQGARCYGSVSGPGGVFRWSRCRAAAPFLALATRWARSAPILRFL
ncbi:uncharacterized protein [Aegilops tauschii subsp. strangulata]|uniref:uncharacterized protein isoform X2 n=1 Tax=Aegilops tauschii subsp. strangulata TaxID=200361 RepID=UPI003CC89F98